MTKMVGRGNTATIFLSHPLVCDDLNRSKQTLIGNLNYLLSKVKLHRRKKPRGYVNKRNSNKYITKTYNQYKVEHRVN